MRHYVKKLVWSLEQKWLRITPRDIIFSGEISLNWVEANDFMQALTTELESQSSRKSEAKEMLDFLVDDWSKLRNRLDSSGVSANNEMRIETERALSASEKSLSDGSIDSCLELLGKADSAMEALRRLV